MLSLRLRLPRDGYSTCQTTTRLEMKIPSWYFGFFYFTEVKKYYQYSKPAINKNVN